LKLVNEMTDEQISKIKLIISDFDGVLTDNSVYTDQFGNETVRCSKYDSIGISQITEVGVEFIVVSSESNPTVSKRCEKLKSNYYTNVHDKGEKISQILTDRQLSPCEVLYIGNDINDLNALKFVDFKVCVNDSHPDFIAACDFMTQSKGGQGCIREICDIIKKGKMNE
jgi:3-deoxy-D-manno-octulosonate 8-phosphate phosphatase (KDO 8-P phosphatase)